MSGILCMGGRGLATSTTTVSPSIVYGVSNFGIPTTVRSRVPVTVSVSGGTPPYTYIWTAVSGDADIYADTPNSPSTYFSAYFDTPGFKIADWSCEVIDALAASVDSDVATVNLSARTRYDPNEIII